MKNKSLVSDIKDILCFFGLHEFVKIGSFEIQVGYIYKKMLGGVYDFFLCINCEKEKIKKKEKKYNEKY